MGAGKQAKGRVGKRQKNTPPSGTAVARSASDQPGKPFAGFMFEKVCKCRRRLNAGDARGEAPCIEKPWSPPSPEGKGAGGMGAKKKTKGRAGGRQRKHAPAPLFYFLPLPAAHGCDTICNRVGNRLIK